jgi:hypothetical protein
MQAVAAVAVVRQLVEELVAQAVAVMVGQVVQMAHQAQ